jgi:hypothetical protein
LLEADSQLEQLKQENQAQPMRRINTGGIVIVLGDRQALPAGTAAAMPLIEHMPMAEVSDE